MRMILMVTLATLMLGSQISGAVVSVNPDSDRTAQMSSGVAVSLHADNDGFLRTFGVSSYWRSALEFDLSGVVGNVITSATLRLVDEGTQVAATIEAHGYSGDGVVTLGDFAYSNQVASYQSVTQDPFISNPHILDVTSFVQSLVNANANYAGFMLMTNSEGIFAGADIASNEYSNPNIRPLLTIESEEVPEPMSLLIWGVGGIGVGIAGYRRRKKATN